MFTKLKQWMAQLKDGPVDWDELEANLIQADLGLTLTQAILASLQNQAVSAASIQAATRTAIENLWPQPIFLPRLTTGQPQVWWMVGINGVGKTTTLAKLAAAYSQQKKKVHLVGADTFRAAAGEQLQVWASRLNLTTTIGANHTDPGAAAFQGIDQGFALGADLILIDTAGRLHNKENLMRELSKVRRVIQSRHPSGPEQTLLVIDATNGTNALSQAREFHATLGVTGVIASKLDSSAKGGVIAALKSELNLNTLWIGKGESVGDLHPFSPPDYAATLLAT
jgi:fused signal recognition particle receptor